MVAGADAYTANWVARQEGRPVADYGPCSAGAIMAGEVLIGGIVYSNYARFYHGGATMELSIATISPRWCTRRVLRDIFAYPFRQMKVTRLQAVCRVSNARACRLVERLGFTLEGRARIAFEGKEDVNLYSMLPHECRWLK